MSSHTGEIINAIFPETTKDWKCENANMSLLASIGSLICSVADTSEQQCTAYLQIVIKKMIQPLDENIKWMRTEQAKANGKIQAEKINKYIYDSTCEYLDLIGEFCKSCNPLIREYGTVSPFEPIFNEIWPFIKQILEEFSHLEKFCESATRLLKHSFRVVP